MLPEALAVRGSKRKGCGGNSFFEFHNVKAHTYKQLWAPNRALKTNERELIEILIDQQWSGVSDDDREPWELLHEANSQQRRARSNESALVVYGPPKPFRALWNQSRMDDPSLVLLPTQVVALHSELPRSSVRRAELRDDSLWKVSDPVPLSGPARHQTNQSFAQGCACQNKCVVHHLKGTSAIVTSSAAALSTSSAS